MLIIIFLVFLASLTKSFKLETIEHVPCFLGCTFIEAFLGVVKEDFYIVFFEYGLLAEILQILKPIKFFLFSFQIRIVLISYILNFFRFEFFLNIFQIKFKQLIIILHSSTVIMIRLRTIGVYLDLKIIEISDEFHKWLNFFVQLIILIYKLSKIIYKRFLLFFRIALDRTADSLGLHLFN